MGRDNCLGDFKAGQSLDHFLACKGLVPGGRNGQVRRGQTSRVTNPFPSAPCSDRCLFLSPAPPPGWPCSTPCPPSASGSRYGHEPGAPLPAWQGDWPGPGTLPCTFSQNLPCVPGTIQPGRRRAVFCWAKSWVVSRVGERWTHLILLPPLPSPATNLGDHNNGRALPQLRVVHGVLRGSRCSSSAHRVSPCSFRVSGSAM